MSMGLPEKFLDRLREQLGDEYTAFVDQYKSNIHRGIRINTLKTDPNDIIRQAPFNMEPVPWVENGFFIEDDGDPAGHPFYKAGLYYIQEPSAMTPADRLDIVPGDKVLDLCAAPGGKATALAAKLKGKGLLVANDLSASRCKALLHNLELFGAENIVVTNEVPSELEKRFPEYFDKILVDAPCSGEGMFGKEPAVAETWTPERVEYFSVQQRSIIRSAVNMLKPGGMMMYSTCTFSKEENEGSISFLLENFPEMKLCEIKPYAGFSNGVPEWGNNDPELKRTVRIWPHKMPGAGHFLALLKKDGEPRQEDRDIQRDNKKKKRRADEKGYNSSFNKEERAAMDDFLALLDCDIEKKYFENKGGKVYYMAFDKTVAYSLKFLRCGLYMGELKKKRFEPSQALALWYKSSSFKRYIDLDSSDERVDGFIKGEPVKLTESEKKIENGLILVKVNGFSLGFGKKVNDIIKNKFLWLR